MHTIPQLFERIAHHLQQGEAREAALLIGKILQEDRRNCQALVLLAQIRAQAGDFPRATALLRHVLEIDPRHGEACFGLAALHHGKGEWREAATWYRRANELRPRDDLTLYNLALVQQALGETDAAIEYYRKALALNPGLLQAYNNLGNLLLHSDRLDEAADCYNKALSVGPDLVESHFNLGLAMRGLNRPDQAKASFLRAIELQPGHAQAMLALGALLHDQRDIQGAIKWYEASITHDVNNADSHFNLGKAYHDAGRFADAAEQYRQALRLKPEHAGSAVNLGKSLQDSGKSADAIQAYQNALSIDPSLSAVYFNLGVALKNQGRLAEWLANHDNFARHDNSSLLYLLYAYEVAFRTGEFARENALFDTLLSYDFQEADFTQLTQVLSIAQYRDVSQGQILALYRHLDTLAMRMTGGKTLSQPPQAVDGRRIRLGYLSPDFKHHVMGKLMAAIFTHHDRARFEIHAYSLSNARDELTATLVDLCDQFKRINDRDALDAARLIAADRLDLLVDLAGLTDGSNPMILAYRPAPLQLTHLGYHGAIGLSTVDYKLTDRHADLPGNEDHLIEKLLPMETCVMPFHHVEANTDGPTRASLGIPEDAILFGEFVNPAKLSQRCLATWKCILDRVENARLVFSPLRSFDQDGLIKRASAAGISPERIVFIPTGTSEAMARARYRLMDIVLDTFPYTGGDTTMAALDMAVPLVTLCGTRQSERMTYSILKHLGVEDGIANSEDEFIEIACRLALDPDKRAHISAKIRQALAHSSMSDMGHYTKNLENAYLHALALNGPSDHP